MCVVRNLVLSVAYMFVVVASFEASLFGLNQKIVEDGLLDDSPESIPYSPPIDRTKATIVDIPLDFGKESKYC